MPNPIEMLMAVGKKKSPRESMMDAPADAGNETANVQDDESMEEYPDDESAEDKVEFKPPQTWRPPSGTRPGDTINAMVSLRVKPDGTVCIEKLDNTSMPGYESSGMGGAPEEGDTSMMQSQDNTSQGRIG